MPLSHPLTYLFPLHHLLSFPTRRSSDLRSGHRFRAGIELGTEPTPRCGDYRVVCLVPASICSAIIATPRRRLSRSEEHTFELQSRPHLVCRLLLEKKNNSLHIQISFMTQ